MREKSGTDPHEWLLQAQYDLKSAEVMFENRRYIHTVFLCHLAVEKALKGLFASKAGEMPPRTHNLVYLAERAQLKLTGERTGFLAMMNGVGLPTRYPDELKEMQKTYSKVRTAGILEQSREMVKWLKTEF